MKKLKIRFTFLSILMFSTIWNTKLCPEFCKEAFNFYDWEEFNKIKNPDPFIFLEIIQKFNDTCLNQISTEQYWPLTQKNFFENFNIMSNKIRKNINSYNIDSKIKLPHVCILKNYPDEKTYIIGDLHGNIDFFKIVKNMIEKDNCLSENLKLRNANIIFLGDYVDRGNNGMAVITTAMILKIINPNNVILLRGNHENIDMNNSYNFLEEINLKMKKNNFSFIKELEIAYELMPSACYLSVNRKKFLHLSHAGFEFRFNPNDFIKKATEEKIQFSHISIKKPRELPEFLLNTEYYLELFSYNINPDPIIGFSWNDITKKYLESGNRGAGEIKYGEDFLNEALDEYKLSNTFIKFIRGHQHTLPKKQEIIYLETCGVKDITEKTITLISTTVNCDTEEFAIKFLPTYLEISTDENNITYKVNTCN